jgi:hypothetical protein
MLVSRDAGIGVHSEIVTDIRGAQGPTLAGGSGQPDWRLKILTVHAAGSLNDLEDHDLPTRLPDERLL